MTKPERLAAILLLLQERKRTCEEIADAFGVSRRTIIRDVQALNAMGIPVFARDGAGGGYSVGKGFSSLPLEITWRESVLLLMALQPLAKMETPFAAERASLLAKIRAMLPDRHRALAEEILQNVGIDSPDRAAKAPLLEELIGLVGTGAWLRLTYHSAEGDRTFVVRPDRLSADRGHWYLGAMCDGKGRTFRVDRVAGFEPCEAPTDTSEPLPYGHASHPKIRVRLSARGIRTIERDVHLGHAVEGRTAPFTLEFNCPPEELDWYAKFLGSMGRDAVVEGPPELIDMIRTRARDALDLYFESS